MLSAAKRREATIRAREQVTTLVLRERREPRETYVHIRGEFLRKGKTVSPAVPEFLAEQVALSPAQSTAPPTRLDLARWLVSPEHPLTPRVTINRQWQVFFGKGLVLTENDFGLQGEPPSHPELLDWLAAELVAQDWSLKALHRQIVLSSTYRQASHARWELPAPAKTVIAAAYIPITGARHRIRSLNHSMLPKRTPPARGAIAATRRCKR